MAFGIDFENFAFAGQLSKNVTGTFKKIGFLKKFTKLHQIRWNQLVRCTYGVILSCFEGAVAFGIDFENFAFAGQLSKNVTGTLKKIGFLKKFTKLHQITWNQLVRCTYGVILSCFEGAVAFGIDFENFAFAGQLSKNVTGTCKKIGFLTKLHQIRWNQLVRSTYGVILSCFEGAVAFGIDFENFAFAGQLSKNVTGTCKKNWFSQEIHKITPDNMKPTGQMHLRGSSWVVLKALWHLE